MYRYFYKDYSIQYPTKKWSWTKGPPFEPDTSYPNKLFTAERGRPSTHSLVHTGRSLSRCIWRFLAPKLWLILAPPEHSPHWRTQKRSFTENPQVRRMRHEGFWEGSSVSCLRGLWIAGAVCWGALPWQRVLHWLQYAGDPNGKSHKMPRFWIGKHSYWAWTSLEHHWFSTDLE